MAHFLAIDTTTDRTSVALLAGDRLLSFEERHEKTQAQCILPLIDRLLVDSDTALSQLDGLIFGCGPGSFTGLRVACSVAKGLAYACDLPLIPITSLSAIVFSVRERFPEDDSLPVLALLDARMGQLYWTYCAPYQLESTVQVSPASEIRVPESSPLILAGVGIDLYKEDYLQSLQSQVKTARCVYPCAEANMRVAIKTGMKAVDLGQAEPMYVRHQVVYGRGGVGGG